MRVRPAVPADVKRLVALWKEMWEYHHARDPRYATTPLAESWMEDWIGRCVEDERSLVLVADVPPVVGYLLGMVLENPPVVPWPAYGHVSELSVTASERGHGIGRALVEEADEWFRRRGCGYVEANVSVMNEASRAFWSRVGYLEFIERRRREL